MDSAGRDFTEFNGLCVSYRFEYSWLYIPLLWAVRRALDLLKESLSEITKHRHASVWEDLRGASLFLTSLSLFLSGDALPHSLFDVLKRLSTIPCLEKWRSSTGFIFMSSFMRSTTIYSVYRSVNKTNLLHLKTRDMIVRAGLVWLEIQHRWRLFCRKVKSSGLWGWGGHRQHSQNLWRSFLTLMHCYLTSKGRKKDRTWRNGESCRRTPSTDNFRVQIVLVLMYT